MLSKSLCSPPGAQSAVGLPYCREPIVSLARYFPFLSQLEDGGVVGLLRKRREEGKSRKNQVAVCLETLPACFAPDPAGCSVWSSAAVGG